VLLPGESRAAAWRMGNVEICVIYAMTLAELARRLRYKIMSGRMDLI